MYMHLLTALCAALLVSADDKDDTIKKDLKQMEGSYFLSSAEIDGNQVPEENIKQFKLAIKGDSWTATIGDRVLKAKIKLDPTKKPKTIDFAWEEGPQKGQTMQGIYAIEKDGIKICRPQQPDKDRPTQFSTQPGSGFLLVVWKKVMR